MLLNQNKISFFIKHNAVIILFIVLTMTGAAISGLQPYFIINELVARFTRNSFLVLSLIIPIIAGIGLNFGIVVGAMAGQIGLIIVTYFGIAGTFGLFVAALISTPIAIFFGILTGGLFNRTKGQEMISGLIVGFFSKGLYEFLFLFLVGAVIPLKDTPMLKPDGVGLRNTISLGSKYGEGIKYSLDNILKVNLWGLMIAVSVAMLIFLIVRTVLKKKRIPVFKAIFYVILLVIGLVVYNSTGLGFVTNIKAPVVTWLVIIGACGFTHFILRTKLGQDFKAIGQDQHIAKVSGIHVNKTRSIAVVISTVLASWGQIIFLQNIGTMNTYGSHMQVGFFAIAAILIGGASVDKATISQAIIGTLLLHSIFIVSPNAGKAIFGDAQIGEFFRSAVVYGVIGISLALHAWKKVLKSRK